MIKAVLFDFFGVIFSDSYWDFVSRDNPHYTFFRDIKDQVNLGQIKWPEFIQRLAKIMGKPVEEINQLYKAERLDPRMIDYIHELHKTCKVALVTNASDNFIENMLDRANIRKLFNELIVSSQVGYMKPDPRIYIHALQKLEVSPNETVMVDDNAENIKSAESLGLHGIVYKGFDQFVIDMSNLMTNSNQ